ncbi:MAG: pantetheine-phosphate adenylyltransferase [Prevotella sp.]|nr:pantetheine-phosphate adenylyltransferase [Prevotella sp.]
MKGNVTNNDGHSAPQLPHLGGLERTGVFVGSFDPFTIGHDSIVRRALPLFDRLVIGVVGDQVHKPGLTPAAERMAAISTLYANEPRIDVKPYYGLAVDFAKAEGAHYIIKGVRSAKDFEYEREQADINRQIGGIETLLLYAEPQLSSVSSSMVRELMHFGADVSPFLPTQKEKQ